MRKLLIMLGLLLSGCALSADSLLPNPVTNNAVALVDDTIISFAGLGAGKTHDDVHARVFQRRLDEARWHDFGTLPDNVGRLATVAVGVEQLAYVFGGYTVAEDGSEVSTPDVWAYDPTRRTFANLAPMPVPVDDAVAVTYQDRYIYLISGWHDLANVNLVQRYDIKTDTWTQSTPWPGESVFGHAGGIVGNTMVVCDGVTVVVRAEGPRAFTMTNACFRGVIRADDPRRIDWHTLPPHPGPARYRMAATGSTTINGVVFAGGSENPYNFNGIGYNGEPSAPIGDVFVWDLDADAWIVHPEPVVPTMDHRGLLEIAPRRFGIIGGMRAEQTVSADMIEFELAER